MKTAKDYLDLLLEREPQLWPAPLPASSLTGGDRMIIEEGLGYHLPAPYWAFLRSYHLPDGIAKVTVSFCGDSYARSWNRTFSKEADGYVPRSPEDTTVTAQFEWFIPRTDSGVSFLASLRKYQGTADRYPRFLDAGFLQLGCMNGYLTFLDLVSGGVVTIHEEGVYSMMFAEGISWSNTAAVRRYMETQRLYICKDFSDFLRFVCTGDCLHEDEARFPEEPEEAEEADV